MLLVGKAQAHTRTLATTIIITPRVIIAAIVYFKRRVLEQVEHHKDASCVVIDAVSSFTHLDLSVMATLADIHNTLKKRGVRLILAGRKRRLRQWCHGQ